jgi:hypothetical protein
MPLDQEKYPVERCVLRREKRERFVAKCQQLGKAKSRVLNELIDLLLRGQINL